MAEAVPVVKLSICIPTFNRAAHLRNCLFSIAAALPDAGMAVQVCVSDNASADGTAEVAARAAERIPLVYRRNERNLGIARNIVDVVDMASGEFVWILGDDELVLPGALRRLSSLFGENPDVEFYFVNAAHLSSRFVMSFPQPFDLANLPARLEPFSPRRRSGRLRFLELVDPDVSFDFLLGIFLSVFRRDRWKANRGVLDEEAVSDPRTFAHFDNSCPHLKVFAKAFAGSPAYFQAEPLTACLSGAREWAPMYPFIKSVRLVEALEEYRKNGLPLWRYLRCRNRALDSFLPDLANMFVRRGGSGYEYVNPWRLLLANCWFPNFYLSPVYYAARKLRGLSNGSAA